MSTIFVNHLPQSPDSSSPPSWTVCLPGTVLSNLQGLMIPHPQENQATHILCTQWMPGAALESVDEMQKAKEMHLSIEIFKGASLRSRTIHASLPLHEETEARAAELTT
eukprot:scaffold196870_cov19-Tisochrysis_lutea.AAC.1